MVDGRNGGWVDGWGDGRQRQVKDCLQQSKILLFKTLALGGLWLWHAIQRYFWAECFCANSFKNVVLILYIKHFIFSHHYFIENLIQNFFREYLRCLPPTSLLKVFDLKNARDRFQFFSSH